MILVSYANLNARGQVQREQRRLAGTSFSVGRGTKCEIQLPDGRVRLVHAHLTVSESGATIVADGGAIRVNGRKVDNAKLAAGDSIEIGPYVLRVETPPAGLELALAVSLPQPRTSRFKKALVTIYLALPRLSKRRLSYLAFGGIIVLFLLLPALPDLQKEVVMPVAKLPISDARRDMVKEISTAVGAGLSQTWTPGPLSPSHRVFGENCRTCHQKPFVQVLDAACLECHRTLKEHVKRATLTDPHGKKLAGTPCKQCHSEHKGLPIAPRSQDRCADCHRAIKSVSLEAQSENVTDFRTGHPQFRLSLLDGDQPDVPRRVRQADPPLPDMVEHSNLKFNHFLHLDPKGLRDPEGYRDPAGMRDAQGKRTVLKCENCHRPEPDGILMAPVSMERDCRRCHSLAFEPKVTDRQVPHGKEALVATTLREFYARLALGDMPPEKDKVETELPRVRPGAVLTYQDRQRVLALAQEKADRVLTELYDTRGVCTTCHSVERTADAAGWRVAPVKVASHWMPHAFFSHADHATQSCTSCHKVRDSKRAEDIAMPHIARCKDCHVGVQPMLGKVTSDCALCHEYHSSSETWHGAPASLPQAQRVK